MIDKTDPNRPTIEQVKREAKTTERLTKTFFQAPLPPLPPLPLRAYGIHKKRRPEHTGSPAPKDSTGTPIGPHEGDGSGFLRDIHEATQEMNDHFESKRQNMYNVD